MDKDMWRLESFYRWAIPALALLTAAALVPYMMVFWGQPFSNKPSDWAAFGSYAGGVLGPIYALAAFIALLLSLRVQARELAATVSALNDSNRTQGRSADALTSHGEELKKANEIQIRAVEAQFEALKAASRQNEHMEAANQLAQDALFATAMQIYAEALKMHAHRSNSSSWALYAGPLLERCNAILSSLGLPPQELPA